MKTQVMVMKMLAMATTVWSAEMAKAMDVAVYATRATVNMKMKKAPAVGFSPAQEHGDQNEIVISRLLSTAKKKKEGKERRTSAKTGEGKKTSSNSNVLPTDHEVGDAGEDDGRDGPQGDDVGQHLSQEVDRESVVTADILMAAEREIPRKICSVKLLCEGWEHQRELDTRCISTATDNQEPSRSKALNV